MKSSVVALLDQMRELPRWPEISQLAQREGFAEEYIAKSIMSVICFNAPGLTNAIANALFLLPLLPSQGKELLVDEDLMDSFCWELFRFTSRTFIVSTAADSVTAIHSSSGETYSVKGGTLLFTHLPVVMRDDKYWSQPNLFKAGRFRRNSVRAFPLDNSSNNDDVKDTPVEPLPTLVFGCPLGRMNNMEEHKNGRRCPFTFLAHPFMKAVVDMLVRDFRWRLDLTSRTAMTHLVVSSDAESAEVLVVNFAPQNLTGGFVAEADQIPQLNFTGARFADFEEVNRTEK
jgi:cytochrome P450